MADTLFQITLPDEAATVALGRALAARLRPGDCVLLEGEIGAGKSALARAIIRALCGEGTEVPSPTFTLVQSYDCAAGEIWHSDLYRLSDPHEAVELGLTDAFAGAICLVEWPDRLGPYRPGDALTITMAAGAQAHAAQLAGSARWASLLTGLAANA